MFYFTCNHGLRLKAARAEFKQHKDETEPLTNVLKRDLQRQQNENHLHAHSPISQVFETNGKMERILSHKLNSTIVIYRSTVQPGFIFFFILLWCRHNFLMLLCIIIAMLHQSVALAPPTRHARIACSASAARNQHSVPSQGGWNQHSVKAMAACRAALYAFGAELRWNFEK